MSPEELKAIAKELEIPENPSQNNDDLIYEIIDREAIKKAREKTNEENKGKRQRSRISVRKEANKVYTANKGKAEKINEVKPKEAGTQPEPQDITDGDIAEENLPVQQPNEEAANAPKAKKRGRKSKPEPEQAPAEDVVTESTETKPAESEAQEPEATAHVTEFIPIEELASDEGNIPAELIGKFNNRQLPPQKQEQRLDNNRPQHQNRNNRQEKKRRHRKRPMTSTAYCRATASSK